MDEKIVARKRLLNVNIVYSEQAQKLIHSLKNFNIEVFEKEYFEQITVGDRAILDYIFNGKK